MLATLLSRHKFTIEYQLICASAVPFGLNFGDDAMDNIANDPFMSRSNGVLRVLPFAINLHRRSESTFLARPSV